MLQRALSVLRPHIAFVALIGGTHKEHCMARAHIVMAAVNDTQRLGTDLCGLVVRRAHDGAVSDIANGFFGGRRKGLPDTIGSKHGVILNQFIQIKNVKIA